MSIFGSIISKVFHHDAAAAPAVPVDTTVAAKPATEAPAAEAPAIETPAVVVEQTIAPASVDSATPVVVATMAASTAAAVAPVSLVDVAAMLDGLAAKIAHKSDWRHSIVDMMTLLNVDSSLAARRELAHELKYTGDTNDTATMNIWLHKQVMLQLAAHGGKVPDELLKH